MKTKRYADPALKAWILKHADIKIEDLPDVEFNESPESPLFRILAFRGMPCYGVRQTIHVNGWWGITVRQFVKKFGIENL